MKKLLIVLALCVFAVSCCEVDHNNSQKKEPEKITATSFKVYTQRGSLVCEYYEFMYHGHKYITNYGEKFLLHSPVGIQAVIVYPLEGVGIGRVKEEG